MTKCENVPFAADVLRVPQRARLLHLPVFRDEPLRDGQGKQLKGLSIYDVRIIKFWIYLY